jgi:trk system potassium uptake protein TrkA
LAKRIVIVGAGVVGTTIAERLSEEHHNVVLIERSPDKAREISESLDIQVVTGNGCSLPVLREAALDRADLLLAVTDSDEVNMITALVAGTSFEVPLKVIRLRSQEYLENIRELARAWPGETYGISPDRAAADRILALLQVPHALDVTSLLDNRVVVAGFKITPGCPVAGSNLADFRQKHPGERFLVATVYRGGEPMPPSGETRLQIDDIAYFSTVPEDIPKLLRIMNLSAEQKPRLVVGGGGHIGKMVAETSISRGVRTAVVRRDRQEAERLAVELPDATVLSGDIGTEEILLEAGVDRGATFVAVTNSHEVNLLSSVIAQEKGAQRVIPLLDRRAYIHLAEAMKIHTVVSPRLASVGEILKFVRGAHVEELASLPLEKVEVAVVEVDENSPLSGKPIRALGLPRGVLITAIAKDDQVLVPGGNDIIPPGSKVVLFSPVERAPALERFMS